MPYKNIVFIKVRLELLNDFRFTDQLNDDDKPIYLYLLILAGATSNKIPDNPAYIKRVFNLQKSVEDIEKSLKNIEKSYPKCIRRNGHISFKNFEEIHNYTVGASKKTGKSEGKPEENPRKSEGLAREEKIREDKKRGEKDVSLQKLAKQNPKLKKSLEKMGIKFK